MSFIPRTMLLTIIIFPPICVAGSASSATSHFFKPRKSQVRSALAVIAALLCCISLGAPVDPDVCTGK
jgi:hypothetical protein